MIESKPETQKTMRRLSLTGAAVLLAGVVSMAHTETPSSALSADAVRVGDSKLYYEECGSGSDAVVLIHDGVVNSAAWNDVWPDFCRSFIPYATIGVGTGALQRQGHGIRR